MSIHVLIRSNPPCPSCLKTKALLERRGLAFTAEDHETPEKVETFVAAGHRTFPRVFIDDKLIGGFEDLERHLASLEDDDF
jgi:glutaredoxin 3